MADMISRLRGSLDETATAWLDEARGRVEAAGPGCIPELLPQLPRRVGRDPFTTDRLVEGAATVDLGAWRRCDAVAYALLQRADAPGALELDLFAHGDLEERAMVLRGLGLMPVTDATVALLGEAQRTNTVTHFEAAVCENNLAARAVGHHGFGEDDFNRVLLKLAFLDLPLARAFDAEQHANVELSRMLQGLATEREAAGRAVWADTNQLIALAPTAGTLARLVGHLEHGDDRQRLAAAIGLGRVNKPELAPFLSERLEREPRAEIRDAIQRALS